MKLSVLVPHGVTYMRYFQAGFLCHKGQNVAVLNHLAQLLRLVKHGCRDVTHGFSTNRLLCFRYFLYILRVAFEHGIAVGMGAHEVGHDGLFGREGWVWGYYNIKYIILSTGNFHKIL